MCEGEKLSNFVSQICNLLKFREIGLAAIEEAAIFIQECGHVALQILHLEIAGRLFVPRHFPFLFDALNVFLFNERHTSGALRRRILLIGFAIRAPIDWRCR